MNIRIVSFGPKVKFIESQKNLFYSSSAERIPSNGRGGIQANEVTH